jgi:hypothetical protein
MAINTLVRLWVHLGIVRVRTPWISESPLSPSHGSMQGRSLGSANVGKAKTRCLIFVTSLLMS